MSDEVNFLEPFSATILERQVPDRFMEIVNRVGDEVLSDDEKAELMVTLQDTVDDLQKESEKLEGIKNKTISSGYTES